MAGEYVRARLREKDRDIRTELSARLAVGEEEADIVRAALRMYFGIGKSVPSQPIRERLPILEKPKKAEVKEDSSIDNLLGQF